MSKFIAVLALWAISAILGYAAMIYGWGLDPKSWGWIISNTLGQIFLVMLISTVVKSED